MIIGNGMIANALLSFKDDNENIIFASGVSNSKETNEEAFKREIDLLLNQDKTKNLIYFSSCSIYDITLQDSHYVKHKIRMEKLIQEQFNKFCILRLPTLIGRTNNPFTFFNNIRNKIIQNEEVVVFKNAWRYIFDVEDLSILLPIMLKNNVIQNKTIDLAYDNAVTVSSIVGSMFALLRKPYNINLIEAGQCFVIHNKRFLNFLKEYNINIFYDDYNFDRISKYIND